MDAREVEELKEDLEGLTQAMLKKIGGDLKESQSDALASCMQGSACRQAELDKKWQN